MVENTNYQMAIDMLRCHLGLTEEEAKVQLGISDEQMLRKQMAASQQALSGYSQER